MKKVTLALAILFLCCFLPRPALADSPVKRILIDEYYAQEGTRTLEDASVFYGRLLGLGYEVDVNKEPLNRERLEEYDVVILYFPARSLEEAEREALLSFVKKGGGLIILGQWTRGKIGWNEPSHESFNELVENFGTTFDATAVDDTTNKAGCHCTPVIHVTEPHPIMENVRTIVMYWPCSLSVKEGAVLARGDDDTVATDYESLTITGTEVVVAAASEYGRGRVVITGSSGIFLDRWADQPGWDNITFMLNAVSWAGENSGKTDPLLLGLAIGVLYLAFIIGIFETADRIRRIKEKE